MHKLFETIMRPDFWTSLWADIVELMSQGTPPVYVQLLLATVVFLAYRLFFRDDHSTYDRTFLREVLEPSRLTYVFAVMVIIAGGINNLRDISDPHAIVDSLRQEQQKLGDTITNP